MKWFYSGWAVVVTICLLTTVKILDPTPIQSLRLQTFDALQTLDEPKNSDEVVIINIGEKDSVLCINESLLQFNRITEKPFVEILVDDGLFKVREVEVGLSDGIYVEILNGVSVNDKIKVWNNIEEESDEEVRERQDENAEEFED